MAKYKKSPKATLFATILGLCAAGVLARAAAPPKVEPTVPVTLSGTIMCKGVHRGELSTEDCSTRSRFVFVSHNHVYDIRNQSFSGLKPLVGQPLAVTAE